MLEIFLIDVRLQFLAAFLRYKKLIVVKTIKNKMHNNFM